MLTLFFVLTGLSLLFGKKNGGKWFLKQVKNLVLWPLKAGWKAVGAEAKTIFQNFWRSHRIRVWSFCFGAGIAGIALSPIGFWWTLFILLIAVGGLLAGLAFSTWRGAQDDFREWTREQIGWIWGECATQIRWGTAGAIVTAILKLGPT